MIVGKVVQIAGSVVAKQSFQGKRTLTTGSPLYVSDEIIVGQDSGVEISYTDGSLLDLGENTDFHIRDYQYKALIGQNKNVSELTTGAFRFLSGDIKPSPAQYNIKTPNATIGLLGTLVEGQMVEETLYVSCTKGKVEVRNPAGSVVIGQGLEQYAIVTSYTRRPRVYTSPPTPFIRPNIAPHHTGK